METKPHVFNKENMMKLSSETRMSHLRIALMAKNCSFISVRNYIEQNAGWFKSNVIKVNTDFAYHIYGNPQSKRFLEQSVTHKVVNLVKLDEIRVQSLKKKKPKKISKNH